MEQQFRFLLSAALVVGLHTNSFASIPQNSQAAPQTKASKILDDQFRAVRVFLNSKGSSVDQSLSLTDDEKKNLKEAVESARTAGLKGDDREVINAVLAQ